MYSNNPQKSSQVIERYKQAKISIYFRVVGITLGNLLIFLLIGYIIDAQLGTSPWGVIFALVLSFTFTQYLLYKYVKRQSTNGFNSNKPRKDNNYR